MKTKWNIWPFIGFIVLSLTITPAGMILGAVNIKNTERRTQAIILLILAVIMTLLWLYHFLGGHHAHH
jgi:heme/copper-type cytochrome/quinol oxidase subunit 4